MTYRTFGLKRLAGRLRGGIPLDSIDMHTLYTVRAPNGALCPGRVLETHRLWEFSLDGLSPAPLATPMRSRWRVLGLLAITNRTISPAPSDVARLVTFGRPVLSDDPGDARRALAMWQEELSRTGMDSVRLDDEFILQPRTFAYELSVVDPYRVLRYRPPVDSGREP